MATGLAGWTALAVALVAAPVLADDGCGARSAARAEGTRVAQMQDKLRDAASERATDKATDAIQDRARDAGQLPKDSAPTPATPALPGGQAMPGTATNPMPGGGTPALPGGQAMPGAAATGAAPAKETVPAGDVPKPPSGY